jgi:hypothetical protein
MNLTIWSNAVGACTVTFISTAHTPASSRLCQCSEQRDAKAIHRNAARCDIFSLRSVHLDGSSTTRCSYRCIELACGKVEADKEIDSQHTSARLDVVRRFPPLFVSFATERVCIALSFSHWRRETERKSDGVESFVPNQCGPATDALYPECVSLIANQLDTQEAVDMMLTSELRCRAHPVAYTQAGCYCYNC